MAIQERTDNATEDNSLIVQETIGKLRELVDEARSFLAVSNADVGEGITRRAFIDWSERTATARGYLECLTTLNLLAEADEIAWYEYLSGTRETPPDMEDV